MAVLMIYDRDNSLSDPVRDFATSYKKGYVMAVFQDPDAAKASKAEPFVTLSIGDKDLSEMSYFLLPWIREITYQEDAYDLATDAWTLSLIVSNPGVSNLGAATQDDVDRASIFIGNWGGTNVAIVNDSMQFDISIFSAVTSRTFWNCNISMIDFTELSYDQTSGIHIISADYNELMQKQYGTSSSFMDVNLLSTTTLQNCMKIISNDGGVIVFYVNRDDVVAAFQADIKRLSSQKVCLRRHYFSSAGVDALIAGGRTLSVATEAEISSYIIDRTTEVV